MKKIKEDEARFKKASKTLVKRKSNNNKRLYNTSINEFSCFLFHRILRRYLLILYYERPEFAVTFYRVQVKKSTTIVL